MVGTSGMDDALPPLSKTEYVVKRLRADIESGQITPGELLKQTVIAKRYGVSATPVREALRLLEADHTIQYSTHRGATVREMPPSEVTNYYRLRSVVEGLATELAVPRMTPAKLDEIGAIHEKIRTLSKKGKPTELSALNMQLHFAIYEVGSSMVTDQARGLWKFIPPNITLWKDPTNAGRLIHDHEEILAAVNAGDAEAARDHMARHIMNAARMRRAV